MSGRIEMYDSKKESTSKWSKNKSFKIREAGVDIEKDYQGGSGGGDYNNLDNKPKINGHTVIGNKTQEDYEITGNPEPLTNEQISNLITILN